MTRRERETRPAVAEIRVGVWLEYDLAAKWFPGMSLRHEQGGATVLRGPLPDQAALFGVLHRLRDLAIPLLSVRILMENEKPPAVDCPPAGLPGDSSMTDPSASAPHPAGESVLITGCSSGIGQAAALHLASRGFHVLATVRKESDAERLRGFHLSGLEPICPLDLADAAQIAAASAAIRESLARKGRDRLYAVVNNAGDGFIAPLELMDLGRFRTEMEARVLGPVALLQNLLPLVRRARGGRILWITAPAPAAVPYAAGIHACEFAIDCVAQSLDLELSPWDIPNIRIGCDGIHTAAPARRKVELDAAMREWPGEKADGYSKSLHELQDQLERFDARRSEPEEVARIVHAALLAKKPKRKYLVGRRAGWIRFLRVLPQATIESIFRRRI